MVNLVVQIVCIFFGITVLLAIVFIFVLASYGIQRMEDDDITWSKEHEDREQEQWLKEHFEKKEEKRHAREIRREFRSRRIHKGFYGREQNQNEEKGRKHPSDDDPA